jgi:SAM-dependent methyltransferase
LKFLRDKGFRVTGLELDQEYIKYGKVKYGLDLRYGFIHDLPPSDRFDVIVYNHVFEHILDLADELKAISNRLSPDGILYIEVPGIKNLSPYHYDFLRYLHNAHTFHFSLKSLTQICTKHGFELQSGNESVRAIFKKGHKLDPEVLNEYDDIISFLALADSKRNSTSVRINARMSRLRNYLYELKKKLLG